MCLTSSMLSEAVLKTWPNQIAVKRNWPLFAKKLGKRFPLRFSNVESLHHWFPARAFEEQSLIALREGAIEGLAESLELLPASALFGFVTSIAHSLTAAEASEVLEFGISRFELHIAPDYADGLWSEWLLPPGNIPDAVTGFIWSALASPDSAERWQATHCVRRLVELSCDNEIASLLGWLQRGEVGPFRKPTLSILSPARNPISANWICAGSDRQSRAADVARENVRGPGVDRNAASSNSEYCCDDCFIVSKGFVRNICAGRFGKSSASRPESISLSRSRSARI